MEPLVVLTRQWAQLRWTFPGRGKPVSLMENCQRGENSWSIPSREGREQWIVYREAVPIGAAGKEPSGCVMGLLETSLGGWFLGS